MPILCIVSLAFSVFFLRSSRFNYHTMSPKVIIVSESTYEALHERHQILENEADGDRRRSLEELRKRPVQLIWRLIGVEGVELVIETLPDHFQSVDV